MNEKDYVLREHYLQSSWDYMDMFFWILARFVHGSPFREPYLVPASESCIIERYQCNAQILSDTDKTCVIDRIWFQ